MAEEYKQDIQENINYEELARQILEPMKQSLMFSQAKHFDQFPKTTLPMLPFVRRVKDITIVI